MSIDGSTNNYVNQIRNEVLLLLKQQPVRVFLFGSRARKDFRSSSDVDIGLIPRQGFNNKYITLLREKLETMNTPYKIEVVNFEDVSENFKQEAMKDVIVWKD